MIFKKLGPGMLYAGAAIGVSHLVQSTKAGALYGTAFLGVIILANILKYPFFEFGVRYASVTRQSLLDGYKKLGNWAIPLFIVATISTMFTVQAAVTIVTAALFEEVFGLNIPLYMWSLILLMSCAILLIIGKYNTLDKLIKWVIIILAILLIITLIAAFLNPENQLSSKPFDLGNETDLLFFIALVGWMPAPFDITVWNSVWTKEKSKSTNRTLKEALFDFKIGYWGTTILACFFMLLGGLMMFNTGEELSNKGTIFAGQVINLFTNNLGSWSYYFIAIASMLTMFSTTITCYDAFPRSLAEISKKQNNKIAYWTWLVILGIGVLVLLSFFSTSMGEMIQIATLISFVSAPILGIMNLLVVTHKNFPKNHQPSLLLKILSWLGIIFLVGFTFYYLYNKIT